MNILAWLRSNRTAGFRRWVVALCLSMFVFAGMAHVTCEIESTVGQTAGAMTFSLSGDQGDDSAPVAAIDIVHCHGCTNLALLDPIPVAALKVTAARPVARLAHAPSSADRKTDTPPPKRLA